MLGVFGFEGGKGKFVWFCLGGVFWYLNVVGFGLILKLLFLLFEFSGFIIGF